MRNLMRFWDLDGTLVEPLILNKDEQISQDEYARRTAEMKLYPKMAKLFRQQFLAGDTMTIVTGRKKSFHSDTTLKNLKEILETDKIEFKSPEDHNYFEVTLENGKKEWIIIEYFPEDGVYSNYILWKKEMYRDSIMSFTWDDYTLNDLSIFAEIYEDDLDLLKAIGNIGYTKLNICKNGEILDGDPFFEKIVIDIETTSINPSEGEIIEFGAVKLNTLSGQISEICDFVIKPEGDFDENAWIFYNSNLTVDDVKNGVPMNSVRDKIQAILDTNKCVSYCQTFDFPWLATKGFKIGKLHKDMMYAAQRYLQMERYPKVQFCMEKMNIDGKEPHRAIGDAAIEAKILFRLIRTGFYPNK